MADSDIGPRDIKIIVDNTPTDPDKLPPNERKAFFEQMRSENPKIPYIVMESFIAMRIPPDYSKPELKELLLRKTIILGIIDSANYVVTPIISKAIKEGGADKRSHPQKYIRQKTELNTNEKIIQLRFDTPLRTFIESSHGKLYMSTANENINIIGFVFTPFCKKRTIGAITDKIAIMDFSTSEASAECNVFIHTKNATSLSWLFSDHTDDENYKSISRIFDYIVDTRSYYESQIASQFIIAQMISINNNNCDKLPKSLKKLCLDMSPPTTYVQPNDTKQIATTGILKKLEDVHQGKFYQNTDGDIALIDDINSRNFAEVYYKSKRLGIDSKLITTLLDDIKLKHTRAIARTNNEHRELLRRNKLNIYRSIIAKKFGDRRLAQINKLIVANPSKVSNADGILDLLEPSERKPVKAEFDNREKYLEAVLNNKCGHVLVYKKFRLSKNDVNISKYYNELKSYFSNTKKDNSALISCNVCHQPVLCPHVRDLTELNLKSANYNEVKAAMTRYIDTKTPDYGYYCNICGELIYMPIEAIGQDGDTSTVMDDLDLKAFIWGEISSVIRAAVTADLMIDIPRLITLIRDACYPYISDIERQIIKSKTISADEIKAKKSLYTTIFTYAYLIHLIANSKKKGAEISFKGFNKPQNAKANITVELIKHAIGNILVSKNIAIKTIIGMSAEIIRDSLIEAYKSLQTVQTPLLSTDPENLLTTLLLDPVYNYLYMMYIMDQSMKGKKPPGINRNGPVELIDQVMGGSLQRLEKTDDLFGSIRLPDLKQWDIPAFVKYTTAKGSKCGGDDITTNKVVSNGYIAKSFEIFITRVTKRLFVEPMYKDISAAKSADASRIDVVLSKPHQEYYDLSSLLLSQEEILTREKRLSFAQTYGSLEVKNTRQWSYQNVTLGRIFDEAGAAHKWTIFIMSDGDNTTEVTLNQINADLTAGKPRKTIIDRKCSGCGILWKNVGSLDEKKIIASVRQRNEITNLFKFYSNRCPEGGYHMFQEDKQGKYVCGKCGMVRGNNDIEYFNKYQAHFHEDKNSMQGISIPNTLSHKPPAIKAIEWVPNFNVIIELAERIKVNWRLIKAMGATEKQNYEDIINGIYIPPENEDRYGTRVYIIDGHIKNLLTEYNQLRYFYHVTKPTHALSSIIEESGINKYQINRLSELPDIIGSYNNDYAYVRQTLKPREVLEFCIQSFCEMCLRILDQPAELSGNGDKTENINTTKLRNDFVSYFVKKIIRSEELLTKHGYFNWSLLFGDKENSAEKERIEAEINEKVDKADDETDPFSNDAFDMENDGLDDEDAEGVEIHVEM